MKALYEVRITVADPISGFPFVKDMLVKDFYVVESLQLEKNQEINGYTFEGYTLLKIYDAASASQAIAKIVEMVNKDGFIS